MSETQMELFWKHTARPHYTMYATISTFYISSHSWCVFSLLFSSLFFIVWCYCCCCSINFQITVDITINVIEMVILSLISLFKQTNVTFTDINDRNILLIKLLDHAAVLFLTLWYLTFVPIFASIKIDFHWH